jgi:DNA-binding phage protein
MMALTRDFRETVVERMERDPSFAHAMLDEAATLLLNGEPGPARLVVRDLVNGTLGFEALAKSTGTPSKSLHRMLSKRGNPSMDKLAGIFRALCRELRVELSVRAASAPRRPRRAA